MTVVDIRSDAHLQGESYFQRTPHNVVNCAFSCSEQICYPSKLLEGNIQLVIFFYI